METQVHQRFGAYLSPSARQQKLVDIMTSVSDPQLGSTSHLVSHHQLTSYHSVGSNYHARCLALTQSSIQTVSSIQSIAPLPLVCIGQIQSTSPRSSPLSFAQARSHFASLICISQSLIVPLHHFPTNLHHASLPLQAVSRLTTWVLPAHPAEPYPLRACPKPRHDGP